jgi:hypothetical protein
MDAVGSGQAPSLDFPTTQGALLMKTSLMAIVLAFAGIAAGPAALAQAQPAASQPQQKKEIKDPAEYNAYVSAAQQADPNAKISGMEAFLVQYPNSVMKPDALEILMGAYQQTNNQAKMMDAAQRLLTADPSNLRALALLTYLKRAAAEAGQNAQQNLGDAAKYGTQGLAALKTANKPDGTSDADFQKLKNETGAIFNGAVGMNALQNKDYATAQTGLRAAVEASPADLRNVYPLALAYLTGTPPDTVNGLFFIARAANLAAGSPGEAQIESYGKSQYTKYHGSDQGWTDVMAAAKSNPTPPSGFTIAKYVPPTPAQQAADLVKGKTPADIKQMSFADWELVLSAGAQEDQDKVWTVIKGVPLQMEGQVIKASDTEVQIAESQDDIDQKRADIVITMSGTIPARLMPKEGADLAFEGTPVSYTPSPFVMNMEKGALLTQKPATPAKKPVHKKPAAQ